MRSNDHSRSSRILARSMFRRLRADGYDRSQMIRFATELLSLVASAIVSERAGASAEGAVAAIRAQLEDDAEGAPPSDQAPASVRRATVLT